MNRRQKKKKGLLLVDKRKEKKVVKEVKVKETPIIDNRKRIRRRTNENTLCII